ncbi:tRNA (guanine(26)-N(2))-dimethyltransferase [Thermoproteus tenax]|uniref:tRNA (guanine(26)-N(2))-dimethyltransferase n=1 Tax=Thermoproteus tenax (strain ATCC 35583 / DSM 2078 / JCM 9277 / NBRC 100435 / Kra 1) TaxID=768679 RepID=G4RKK8_THETK|nr:tRNA (guanine(26)-N(2))-dimethyltransferase [Thermoproteus tenax]CCC82103.1 N2,N2-dimethylguanosine tRNA methyltransferase [Thermoproteus tenax Kra 1]
MSLVLLREGRAEFWAPDPAKYNDPARAPVFYNRYMARNRTISTLVLSAFSELKGGPLVVCEPLSATGIRGIRYALETKAVERLILNDISSQAVDLIKKNLELNGLSAEVYNEDANILLRRLGRQCDVVDLDPFGSPAPFMESAFQAIRDGGMLCATATDTAVLVGNYKDKALRRYGVRLFKTPFYVEVGLRALLGYIARVAAANDFAIEPLIAYWERHYFRVCVAVREGAREASDVLRRGLAYIVYLGGIRRVARRETAHSLGPLWVGPLGEPDLVARLPRPQEDRSAVELLNTLTAEYTTVSPWYYLSQEFGDLKMEVRELIDLLLSNGVYATPTHMAPYGFKADAPYGELYLILSRDIGRWQL